MFNKAFIFGVEIFELGKLVELMTAEQMLEFASMVLSIVLSHQWQKDEIKKVIDGTGVDFKLIRDPMYHYCKKSEEKFMENPVAAFVMYKFSTTEKCISFLNSKINKRQDNNDDKSPDQSQISTSKPGVDKGER